MIVGPGFWLSGMIIYGLSYLEKEPVFYCPLVISTDGVASDFQQCNKNIACQQYAGYYKRQYDIYNWNESLNLQCESQSRIGFIGSIYFIGWIVGAMIFPRLSDLYGRKPIVIGSYFAQILVLVIIFLAKNLNAIYAGLFILGLKTSPMGQISYIQLLEFVSTKKRNVYGTLTLGLDGIHALILYGAFALLRDFRPILAFNCILTFILLLLYWAFVPESPRYYLSRGKYKQARRVFLKVAVRNRKKMFDDQFQGEQEQSIKPKQKLKAGILDLFRAGCYITLPLIIMSFNWFIATFVYYGLTLGLKYLDADLYVIGIVQAVAEIIGTMSSGWQANCLGRKKGLIYNGFVAGIACIMYQVIVNIGGSQGLVFVLILIGKFAVSGFFNIVYLITSELFPTTFRGTVFGITNFVARIGGVISPLVNEFMRNSFMIVLGIAGCISGVASMFLRETKGKVLMDSLEVDNAREEQQQQRQEVLGRKANGDLGQIE